MYLIPPRCDGYLLRCLNLTSKFQEANEGFISRVKTFLGADAPFLGIKWSPNGVSSLLKAKQD